MYIFSKNLIAALITWSQWASEAAYFKFSKLWNYLLSLSFLHLLATKPMAKQSRASSLSVSTTPITAMGCRQCLPLSVVQLKGKYCQKPNCPNGVVDTFKPGQLSGGHWIEYSSSKFRFYNITKKIHVQHFWFRFRFLFSKDSFLLHPFESF